jgi:hypothetical protein
MAETSSRELTLKLGLKLAQDIRQRFNRLRSENRIPEGISINDIWFQTPDYLPDDVVTAIAILQQINASLFGDVRVNHSFEEVAGRLRQAALTAGIETRFAPAPARLADLDPSRVAALANQIAVDPQELMQNISDLLQSRLGPGVTAISRASRRLQALQGEAAALAPPEAGETTGEIDVPDRLQPEATGEEAAASTTAGLTRQVEEFTSEIADQVVEEIKEQAGQDEEIRQRMAELGGEAQAEKKISEAVRAAVSEALPEAGDAETIKRAVGKALRETAGFSESGRTDQIIESATAPISANPEVVRGAATAKRVLEYTRIRDSYLESLDNYYQSITKATNTWLNNLNVSLTSEQEKTVRSLISRATSQLFNQGRITPETSPEEAALLIQNQARTLVSQVIPKSGLPPEFVESAQKRLGDLVQAFSSEVAPVAVRLAKVAQHQAQITDHTQPLYRQLATEAAANQQEQLAVDVKRFLIDLIPRADPRKVDVSAALIAKRLSEQLDKLSAGDRIAVYAHMGKELQKFIRDIAALEENIDPEIRRGLRVLPENLEDLTSLSSQELVTTAKKTLIDNALNKGDFINTGVAFAKTLEKMITSEKLPPRISRQLSEQIRNIVLSELEKQYYVNPSSVVANLTRNTKKALIKALAEIGDTDQSQTVRLLEIGSRDLESLTNLARQHLTSLPPPTSQVSSSGKTTVPVLGQAFQPIYHALILDVRGLSAWALDTLLTPVDLLAEKGEDYLIQKLYGEVADRLIEQGWSPQTAYRRTSQAIRMSLRGFDAKNLLRNINHLLGIKYQPRTRVDRPKKPLNPNDPRIIELKETLKAMEEFNKTPAGRLINVWNNFNNAVGRYPLPIQYLWGYKSILLWNTDMALKVIVEDQLKHAARLSYKQMVGRALNKLGLFLHLYDEVEAPGGFKKIKLVAHKKLYEATKKHLLKPVGIALKKHLLRPLWRKVLRPALRKTYAFLLKKAPKPIRRLISKAIKKIIDLAVSLPLSLLGAIGAVLAGLKLIWNKGKKLIKLLMLYVFSLLQEGLFAFAGGLAGFLGGLVLGAKVAIVTTGALAPFLGPLAVIPGAITGLATMVVSTIAGGYLGLYAGRVVSFFSELFAGPPTEPFGFEAMSGAGASLPTATIVAGTVALPAAAALIQVILTSNAFFTPTQLALLPGSKYFNLVKSAEYEGSPNKTIPNPTLTTTREVTYKIQISPPSFSLQNVRVVDHTQVFKNGGAPQIEDWTSDADSNPGLSEIAAGETYTIEHRASYDTRFIDSSVFNTVTVTADVLLEDGSLVPNEKKSTSLVICIGDCPNAQAGAFSVQFARAVSACVCGDESLVENNCSTDPPSGRCRVNRDNLLTDYPTDKTVKPDVLTCLKNREIPEASIEILRASVERFEEYQCVGGARAIELGSGGLLAGKPTAKDYINNPPNGYIYVEDSLENAPVGAILLYEAGAGRGFESGSIAVVNSIEGSPDYPILVTTHVNIDGRGCITINDRNTIDTPRLRGYMIRKNQP